MGDEPAQLGHHSAQHGEIGRPANVCAGCDENVPRLDVSGLIKAGNDTGWPGNLSWAGRGADNQVTLPRLVIGHHI